MVAGVSPSQGPGPSARPFTRGLRGLVLGLAFVSGLSVLAMIVVTCLDVILRLPLINRSLTGAYDITKIAVALSLASALPYTAASKGHIAIEYFAQKLRARGRRILDIAVDLMGMALFAFLAWRTVLYGVEMYRTGQVSQTLQYPIFWVPWVIGFCCGVVVLVLGHHLLYPDREVVRP